MPIHHEDFGKDVVTLYGNDIFFLDTNIVISYLFEQDRHHKVCTIFLKYLLSQNVILCLSEVVIAEAIHGLARLFYANDQLKATGGTARYHRSRWSNHVIKHGKESLAAYNRLACEKLRPFINLCYIADVNENQIFRGMQISYESPLASADALIVSSAISLDAPRRHLYDSDMENVKEIHVYTTNVDDTQFDVSSMISRLGIRFQNYLLSTLGEVEYSALFPTTTPSNA